MPNHPITTIQELKDHLFMAIQLEHATIPPYLTALYTIRPDTNFEAARILRTVVVEEMLHLSLAANLLNAIGGTVDLTVPHFVPSYPAPLPDGEQDFKVSLRPFSREAVDTFLSIERPKAAPTPEKRMVHKGARKMAFALQHPQDPNQELAYYSIGEFYEAIAEGLKTLDEASRNGGPPLFSGDPKKQAGPEHYTSGGGTLIRIKDLTTALAAIETIIEQGEGFDKGVFNENGELSHEYRFEQLKLGKRYLSVNADGKPDTAQHPTGPNLNVDWDSPFPAKVDAKLDDFKADPELYAQAAAFNKQYFCFLRLLTEAFNGKPELLLIEAQKAMTDLRVLMLQLIHTPLPGMLGVNAAPTFEMPVEDVVCPKEVKSHD